MQVPSLLYLSFFGIFVIFFRCSSLTSSITKAKFFYASALHVIVEDVHIPAGAALGVIANPLFLQARDAVGIRPSTTGSDSAFKPVVTVTEFFSEDVDSTTSVNLDDVNNQFLLFEY